MTRPSGRSHVPGTGVRLTSEPYRFPYMTLARSDGGLARTWRGRPVAVWIVLALLAFLGVRGTLGGILFLLAPSGELVGESTASLAGTPFADYLVPGVVLFVLFGIAPLVVGVGLARRSRWAWQATLFLAIALTVWVLVEAAVIGLGERLQFLNLLTAIVLFEVARSKPVRGYLH